MKVYIDDVVVGSKNMKRHFDYLDTVFEQTQESRLKIKLSICVLACGRIEVLGYVVRKDGVNSYPEKIRCVQQARLSNSNKELWTFLMFFSFHRRFVRSFSQIAILLYALEGQESALEWG